jgi:hypothetical protein
MSKYPHVTHSKERGSTAVLKVPDQSVDLVYIDASHGYRAVKQDIKEWLPKVRPGGYITGHDYSRFWPTVVRAVDESMGKPQQIFDDSSWLFKV